MSSDQLKETVLNPENRVLHRITLEDCEEAAAELLKITMGKDINSRKQFIEDNAHLARLDDL